MSSSGLGSQAIAILFDDLVWQLGKWVHAEEVVKLVMLASL